MKMKCGDPNNPSGPGHKANGEICGNTVVPGTHRCYMHGSRAPEALVKAKTQLALLRMPAIEALHTSIEQLMLIIEQFQADTCNVCGFPKGDADEKKLLVKSCTNVARVASLVLDRTDVGPKATLDVKQSDFDLDLRSLNAVQQQQLDTILAQYEALKADVQMTLHQSTFGTLPAVH